MANEDSHPERWATFTIPPDLSGPWIKREKRLNLLGVLLVVAVVVLAVLGMAGVRTATATVDSGGYTLEVLHASITRPGLATPFRVTIRSEDAPLPESVTLRTSSRYLSIFDEHGLTPAPTGSHSDSEWTWWTFQPPEGSHELSVVLDARLEPSEEGHRDATVTLATGGEAEAETQISTWVLP